jgi:hypothetical protein
LEAKTKRLQSNSGKLTGWLAGSKRDQPIHVPDVDVPPSILAEDDGTVNLDDVPEAPAAQQGLRHVAGRPSRKRARRSNTGMPVDEGANTATSGNEDEDEDEDEDDEEDDEDMADMAEQPATRKSKKVKTSQPAGPADADELSENGHDKKKMGFHTSYDGFSIYGRILCLVVKRRGASNKTASSAADSSQQMMENWVSTQAAQDQGATGDDEG